MEIYLDNSATTRVCEKAVSEMSRCFSQVYANPSSKHRAGFEAELEIKNAAKIIADILHCHESEIIFTSGGTESDNLAIFGAAKAKARYGRHFITTQIEHPAVIMPFKELERQGCEVTYLPVDHEGCVSVNDVKNALRDDTVLVSVMMVNNETGSRQPVEEIGAMLKKQAGNTLFHVDAVQGFGQYPIRPAACGIDMLSVSAHKLHGPKGAGFLYVSKNVRIAPMLFGGGQQKDMRPGTQNVPGIVGMAAAAGELYTGLKERVAFEYHLKNILIKKLLEIDGVRINGQEPLKGAPHIISASFEGIRSEVMLHALEEKGIYVSSGSACASNHPGLSGTLRAMGIDEKSINGTIRFSLCGYNTEEEIEITAKAVGELAATLRKYVRK